MKKLRIPPLLFVGLIFVTTCQKPNTPPKATFTISPNSGATNTIFTFDATVCTDREDHVSVLKVRWDWSNDGVWDTQYLVDKTSQHQFLDSGTYIIAMEIVDTDGLTCSSFKQLKVTQEITSTFIDIRDGRIYKSGNYLAGIQK